MDNFDTCNVLLAITPNIAELLMTAFVLQGHIYTTVQSFGISKKFLKVSSAHRGCIYLIKNTVKTVQYYYNFNICMIVI